MRYGVLRGRLAVRAAIVAGAAALLGAGVPAGMASTSADGEADLSVTVSASADQVTAGGTVDYRITVADHGPGDAARVRLHVVLPDSFQFVAASGARICTSDGAVDCVIGEVPHGTTATVDVQARTSAAGTFGTSATVSSPWVDTKPDDNTARASTTVLGSARLTVIDKVTNDDGGTAAPRDFGVRVDGAKAQPSAFSGDAQGTTVALEPGPYAVAAAGGPAGYDTVLSVDCSGTIAPGEQKTCTVAHDDRPAHLTVVEHVVNDGGGRATASSFRLSVRAASSSPAEFAGAEAPGTTVRLSAGPYSVSVGAVAGYQTTVAPECTGTLTLGESRTCTVTSEDEGAPGSGPAPAPTTTTTTTTTTTATAPPSAPPPPVFQQSADAEPVAGSVLVRLPGTADFVPLTAAAQVPIGAELDATDGRVALSTVDGAGAAFRAEFSEGRFKVAKQQADGVTVLRLTGGDFASCKAPKRTLASADKKKKPKRPRAKSTTSIRHLWGSGKGRFQTRGRYVAATVHGTTWFTEDRCDASRVYVQEGLVAVRDLVKRKTIAVPAGKSYVARPRR